MLALPPPIAAYMAAVNAADADGLARCFAEDGRVHDEKEDHVGRAAIVAWATETQRKYNFRIEPLACETKDGKTIVSARVSGDFPGSPVTLDHKFELKDGQIVALGIH